MGVFQQDGATAHTAKASMVVIFPIFSGRLISKFGDILGLLGPLTYLCDLSIISYGATSIKARLYEHKPCTLEELKEAICEKVAQIDKAMIKKVYANFEERLQKCITDSGLTRQMLFSTLDLCKILFQYELKSVNKFLFNKKLTIW